MLYCSVHARVYVPALKHWLPADPVHVHGVSTAIPVYEGVCDACVEEAKASLVTQFPALYIHQTLIPSV
jgi:hypothetical protein